MCDAEIFVVIFKDANRCCERKILRSGLSVCLYANHGGMTKSGSYLPNACEHEEITMNETGTGNCTEKGEVQKEVDINPWGGA